MRFMEENTFFNFINNAGRSFFSKHPLILPVTTFFGVVCLGLILLVVLGATTKGASDKRIVNVSIAGEQRTVSTRAKTVENLLERLEIDILDEDIVEPARLTPIFEDNMQVNVYKARPVQIIDRERTVTVVTAERTPVRIVESAGVELNTKDTAAFATSETTKLELTAPEQVVISRSYLVKLNVYGVLRDHYTRALTVGEVLEENNIVVKDGEKLSPASETPITDGMVLSVNRENITTETVSEDIPFETKYEEDATQEVGYSKLKKAGVLGEKTVIYEVTEQDDVEVSRTVLQTVVNKEPRAAVYIRGTKPATLSSNVNVSAKKKDLMAAAGIAESDFGYVDYIVRRESGWRPGAVNRSSGAYGLCQALPGSKMASAGDDWRTNPVTQLRWCSKYSKRYGGWQGSYNAWLVQHWW